MRSKINIKISLLLAFMMVSSFGMNLHAQDSEASISGVVVDEFGTPQQGVLVKTENGKSEYVTNFDGSYVIPIKDGSSFITFSFPGYKNEVVALDGKNKADIKLVNDAHKTDEIVQLGYTTQSRNSITGAVATVSGDVLAKSPVANLSQTFAGNLLGMTNMEINSELSRSGVYNIIRGLSTVNGREPVVVIDGIICPNTNYEYISPQEIESISILKDASTTALYGIQGSNGVIVITTKRGHTGKVNVDVNFNQSFQQMTRSPEFVNSWDYTELRNQAGYNDGLGQYSQYTQDDIDKYRSGENRELYPNTNYYDMFIKPLTSMQRVGVSVSGGNDAIKYFSNVNYMHQSLPFKVAETGKYDATPANNWFNFRSNVDLKINNYLSGFVRLSGNVKTEKMTGGAWNSDLYSRVFNLPSTMYGPLTPIVEDSESPTGFSGGQVITHDREDSPVYGLLNRSGYNKHTVTNIIAQAGLNLDMSFVTKGLSLSGLMAYQTNTVNSVGTTQNFERWTRTNDKTKLEFVKKGNNTNTPLGYAKSSSFYYNLNFFANMNYDRTFGKHSVNAMAYVFYLQQEKEDWYGMASGMLPYKRQSLGVTATYGFKNTLYAKFDLGYSGSEQFSRDERFIATPAVSAAWVISNESFMSSAKWLTNLKLRASYGKSANDQFGNQRFLYLDDIQEANGYMGLFGNPALHAETVKKQNYGIDFGLFNALSISFDYFRDRSDDLLISGIGNIPEYQGIPLGYYPKTNTGIMENNGFEIGVSYFKRIDKDWSIFAGVNFSRNNNTIIDIQEAKYSGEYAYPYRQTGYSLGQQWGYQIDKSNGNGYFNTQEELENSNLKYTFGDPRLGDFIYKDLNGDDVIDEKDQAPIGTSWLPKHYYSFNAGFSYKALEFSFMFQGANKASEMVSGVGFYENSYEGVFNDIHRNAWTAERYANGDKIKYPALSLGESTNHQPNDYFIMDRSYLRLKNVEVAYSLPISVSKAISAQKIRFVLSAQNLFTIDNMETKYVDPETGVMNAFQPYRIYNVGVSLIF